MTREPYLINIGNNVTVSTNVTFVTHDNSIKLLYPEKSDVFGKIVIGNNCFVGENVTILYGVTLADNIIVAAGSVVTKSFSKSDRNRVIAVISLERCRVAFYKKKYKEGLKIILENNVKFKYIIR